VEPFNSFDTFNDNQNAFVFGTPPAAWNTTADGECIRRKNEQVYLAPFLRGFDIYRVSLAAKLTGLDLPCRRDIEVIPYVLGSAKQGLHACRQSRARRSASTPRSGSCHDAATVVRSCASSISRSRNGGRGSGASREKLLTGPARTNSERIYVSRRRSRLEMRQRRGRSGGVVCALPTTSFTGGTYPCGI
jgi:hypothetical protein